MSNLWYKDAIIYSMDVERFYDSNGDGIGDFQGLKQKLPYIAGLGFNCIWLMPFYPSPREDDGYDVLDYLDVDPRYGHLGDFVEFMESARELGLRVIVDLVVNHTSDQHPWFQSARRDPKSKYRDYYVWSTHKPDDAHKGMVFPGVQTSVWSYDRVAKAYYFHRFYKHQPDLNMENPKVREEICKVIGFWLKLGISGFRVDAAPFLIEMKNATDGMSDPYGYFREFREFLQYRSGDAILLAEANVSMDRIAEYFGDGTKFQMLFNFMLNQHVFLGLARENAQTLLEAIHLPPSIYHTCQWANFLRNHDELDLGRLTDGQRKEVFQAFGPKKSMQLYDRGIRRRLAPMLEGDMTRLRLAYSLMLSLPGTPVIYYGDELGMGEDLNLKERDAVRTVMQWSSDPHGGFSTLDKKTLPLHIVDKGPFAYQKLNVEGAQRQGDSLLNWMERAIRVRRECPEFGSGDWNVVETGDASAFAVQCSMKTGSVVVVHNLSRKPRKVKLDLSDSPPDELVDLLADSAYPPITKAPYEFTLSASGFRWMRIHSRK